MSRPIGYVSLAVATLAVVLANALPTLAIEWPTIANVPGDLVARKLLLAVAVLGGTYGCDSSH